MTIRYPDYNSGLVNLACSILKFYGAAYGHPTLPLMDRLLEKKYRNVVVMLFDGLGSAALKYHLPEDSFLRRNHMTDFSSVFPPTTTAAITSLESGYTPIEHGWLGWSLYFSEVNKIINALPNTDKDSRRPAADFHVAQRYIPYLSIFEKIAEAGQAAAYSVSMYGSNRIRRHDELYGEIQRLCGTPEPKYIYSYWDNPDTTMHLKGCRSDETAAIIADIDRRVADLCAGLHDTLVIVTADHGHIDLYYKFLSDYPKLEEMLIRPISIESRAAGFHVKPEYRDEFPAAFRAALGDDFLLFSREEAVEARLFGDGEPHPKFDELAGDFIAVATGGYGLVQNRHSMQFLSNHAGLTDDEMTIPFIVGKS